MVLALFGVVEFTRWYRRHRREVRDARELVREAEAYLAAQPARTP